MLNGRKEFVSALVNEFPELREEVEDEIYSGLLHLEMACFARYTQDAIDQGDAERVSKCFNFADRFFVNADSNLNNALIVSYLENLNFDSPNGNKAEALLTPLMRQYWLEINEYLKGLWLKIPDR